MSDEPISPVSSEKTQASSTRQLWTANSLIPISILLFVAILAGVVFTQPLSWFNGDAQTQEVKTLKNQIASLNNRLDQLSANAPKAEANSSDSENLKAMVARISSLSQQVEDLMNQAKSEMSSQQLERSQMLEKELGHLAESQRNLKALFLFWRLKAIILSNAPYRKEINDFKSAVTVSDDLSLLEKYADKGLQTLIQKNSDFPFPSDPSSSWWDRIKAVVGSFIKVEKVGSAPSSPTNQQERQTIEEILEQTEQNLIQSLMIPASTTPPAAAPASPSVSLPTPSPQSGDPS
jgi:hypothetical protein